MKENANYEKVKETSSSGTFKTVYHDGSYLSLFKMKKLKK